MFCNFHLVKNHNIAKKSTTTKDREKISADLEPLEFYNFFDVYFAKIKNYQILLNKIINRFLLTTKLFIGQKSLIVVTNESSVSGFGWDGPCFSIN